MKKKIIFGLALIAMVWSFTSCNKDNDEIVETNALVHTTWSYEKSNFNLQGDLKRWGSLQFQTNKDVVVTVGYEYQGEQDNFGNYHGAYNRNETSLHGIYEYKAPNLTITLNAEDGQPAKTLKYIVDEKAKTILPVSGVNSSDEVVYRKK